MLSLIYIFYFGIIRNDNYQNMILSFCQVPVGRVKNRDEVLFSNINVKLVKREGDV